MKSEPEKLYSELTYKEQLDFTQNIKQELLSELMTSGTGDTIPTDVDTVNSMMKVMESMDRTTLSDKKNTIETEGNSSAKELLSAMAMFVKQAKNSNPFAVNDVSEMAQIPEVSDEELGEFECIPGEAEVGTIMEDYVEFNSRMESIRHEELEAEAKELGL